MTYFRNYINKQATLINSNYTNNSRNPVIDISRGPSNLISRYIMNFDITDIREKFDNNEITTGTTFTINFTNTVFHPNQENLIGKHTVDGFVRDSNISLDLFSFDEVFVEGTGFDYIFTTGVTSTQSVPNWFQRDSLNLWSVPGIYSGNTDNVIATQYLSQGNENLVFDITDYFYNILNTTTGTSVNLGISYPNSYELLANSGDTNYKISFFSKYTQTYFEPYLEIKPGIDQVINDQRTSFYLDNNNDLFLYSTKAITIDKVEIYDYNGELYTTLTGNSITALPNNVYKISISVPSTYPDMVNFEDKWYYTKNSVQQSITQEFTLLTEDIFNSEEEAFQNSNFFFSVIGLVYDEKVSRSVGTKKIQISTKRLYGNSIESEFINEFIEYRLYVLQGKTEIEVYGFTPVNKTFFNNYFELDIESLIPNTYHLEIRLKKNNIVIGNSQVVKFKVVSEK